VSLQEPCQRLTRLARYRHGVLTARAPPAEWRTTLQDRTPGPAWSGQGTIASRQPWGPGRAPAPSLRSLESEGDRVICLVQVLPGRHCPPWLFRGQHSQYREAPPWLRVKGTRKRWPKRAENSHNSEEWASQKPRPSSGRRRTGVARTQTIAGPAESSPAVSAQTLSRCTSLQFFLPVSRGGAASIHHLPLR